MAWGSDGWSSSLTVSPTLTAPLIDWLRPSSNLTDDALRTFTGGTTTSNNSVVFGRSVYNITTISIFINGVLQGTTTTDSGGNWNYSLGVQTNATYTLTATVTSGSDFSPASTAFIYTVNFSASAVTAPVITNARSASAGSTWWNFNSGTNTYSNNIKVYGTSGYPGATLTVYRGGVMQGTAVADGSGNWSYALGLLADAVHSITATINSGGVESALSTAFTFTIVASITGVTIGSNMTNTTFFTLSGWSVATQNDPTNPAATIPTDTHTLKFTNRGNDIWPQPGFETCRDEVTTTNNLTTLQVFRVTYEVMLDPSSPVSNATWWDLGQYHSDGNNFSAFVPFVGSEVTGTRPSDQICISVPNGSGGWTELYNTPGNQPRGVWVSFDFECKVDNSGSTGYMLGWKDGVQIINSTGVHMNPTYCAPPFYWKFGVYRNETTGQTQIAWFRNFQMTHT